MRTWDMETGEFNSCWCAEDGCCEGPHYAGWDPAIVSLQEELAVQVASEIVARSRRPDPTAPDSVLIDGEVEDFLQRMYVFQS